VTPKPSLAATHPEIAAQALGWDPTEVTAGSGKLQTWECRLGHKWETSVRHRTRGSGCPICGNRRLLIRFNDLATTHPELAAQAYGWDPSTLMAGSEKKFNWMCDYGHIWSASIVNRAKKGSGCPYCSGRDCITGVNDLATTHPELAAQAHEWDPTTISAGSDKHREWRCPQGHQWTARVANRGVHNKGCPYCSGNRILAGFNDLATTHPELAAQAHEWDPTTVSHGSSSTRRAWRCSLGHVWNATVSNRALLSTGCPYCAHQKLLPGFNDLATVRPDIAAEASGWNPATTLTGSNKKFRWKCRLGHQWTTTINSRTSRGTGCPYCTNQTVKAGFNDLATTHPKLAAQAHGWDPASVVAGSKKSVDWICVYGHTWHASIHRRVYRENDCPYCTNRRVATGFNDLATVRPDIAAEASGWNPATVLAGSKSKRKWKCADGHTWITTPGIRTSASTGCPTCATTGYDPNSNGWIYLLRRESDELLQIGITNVPEKRLSIHRRNGWEVIDLVGPIDGQTAKEFEEATLLHLDVIGVHRGRSLSEAFDGYTEAWRIEDLPVSSLAEVRVLLRE
jgi:hypothetical protein